MDIEFEGRPLDLGDTLWLQKDDSPERVKVRIASVSVWTDKIGDEDIQYMLTECERSGRHNQFADHYLSLAKVQTKCIRDPADRERRKGERRKQA